MKSLVTFLGLMIISVTVLAQETSQTRYYSYGKCSSKGWLSGDIIITGSGETAQDAETAVYQLLQNYQCFNRFKIEKTEAYNPSSGLIVKCTAACKGYGIFEGPQDSSRTVGEGFNRTHAEAVALIKLNQKLYSGDVKCANESVTIIGCE